MAFARKRDAIAQETARLKGMFVSAASEKRPAYELLRRPEVRYADLPQDGVVDPVVAEQIEIQAKYEGYIERQRDEVARRGEFEDRAYSPSWITATCGAFLRKSNRSSIGTAPKRSARRRAFPGSRRRRSRFCSST